MSYPPRYSFNVAWSSRDQAFIATCPSFPDLSAFGDTPQEAIAEAQIVVEMYVAEYEEEGVPLPEPQTVQEYSGRILLRMPKSLHAQLARAAEREGVSLNALMIYYLSEAHGGRELGYLLKDHIESLVQRLTLTRQRFQQYIDSVETAGTQGSYQDPLLNSITAQESGD